MTPIERTEDNEDRLNAILDRLEDIGFAEDVAAIKNIINDFADDVSDLQEIANNQWMLAGYSQGWEDGFNGIVTDML